MAANGTQNLKQQMSEFRRTKTWARAIRHTLSYIVLGLGSMFMLFPMLWMFSSSFKPPWQIFTDPPIWLPHRWENVQAGNTNREIDIWRVSYAGETEEVINIGTRRYTTVLNLDLLTGLQSAPSDQLSDAVVTEIDGLALNMRLWDDGQTVREVVAIARGEDDDLIVMEVDELLTTALRLPLDEVNAGQRATLTVNDIDFRGRSIETDDGQLDIFPIGPETQFTVVAPYEIAYQAELISQSALIDAGFTVVGDTALPRWQITDDLSETGYIMLAQEAWQPIIDEVELELHALVAENQDLSELVQREVNDVLVDTATLSYDDGRVEPAVILIRGTDRSLVIPEAQATTLRLAQAGGLTSTRGATRERIPYRVQDGFRVGDHVASVALIGDQRNMALVVPESSIDEAFDVPQEELNRALTFEIRLDGYKEALETKVASVYFPRFFLNSFGLVFLNILGHLLSCVVVAYAFARLRAPGKNFLFLIVLSTMMLPFPVTLVPLYEIFRDFDMINTWWPLFIRSFFGNAFLIFMLRQFFASIPKELEDAARIDGASTLGIIWRIIVPLSKPALATVVIFTFWWTWNSFLEPFIYLTSPELFPVSVGLNFFKDQFGAIYYDRLIAASVLSMLPMILLFFFAQRYFIEGIQLTGLKG